MHRRTTIWVAGLWSLLFGTAAHALSLGDIEVYSALNQPLEAEILLTSVRAGETEGMLVRLASEEAFIQAGVDRPFYLTKIKFRLDSKPDGTQYIRATTDNPVREPFLSFLIDIDWPRGHLVREYTVLLDPPVFTGASQMPSQAAALPSVTDSESAAGEPALIDREEDDGLTDELPDIEMVDESGAVPTDAAFEANVDQSAEVDTEAGIDQTAVVDGSAFEEIPGAEIPAEDPLFAEDLPQDMPADSTGIMESGEIEDSSLSTRLQQQPLPDINFTFDETLPYDVARTEALLAEFGISLSSMRAESEEPAADRADSYEVQDGDTLWEIADRNKDADVSVQQAMLAILRYNPNGFIRNNINDVKKGFVLRMPERQAMLEVSRQEASAEVKRQYALWREYRGELAGITSAQQDAVAADRQTQADTASRGGTTAAGGQLSILAPGRDAESTNRSSGAQQGKEKGGSTAELDLQLAREQLEAERLEKTELQSRLTDLTAQIETMQRLLTLKDEQLAKLQERLRQLEAAKTAPAPTPDQSKIKPEAESESKTPAGADDKSTAKKTPLSGIPDFEPELKAPIVVPAPDIAGRVPQPDTTTPDTTTSDTSTQQTPATGDLEKLSESGDITLQPDTADPLAKKPKTKKPEAKKKRGKSYLERLDAVLQPVQGFLRDQVKQLGLPSPYNKMLDDALATPVGLGILAALLIAVLVLLVTVVRSLVNKVKNRESKPKKTKPAKVIEPPPEQVETARITAPKADAKPKVSLGDRLKKVFAPFGDMLAKSKKPRQAKAESSDDDGIVEAAAAAEDLASAVKEAAVEAKTKTKAKTKPAKPPDEDLGKTVVIKPAAKAAPAAAAEEEISDDTTAEADVYLAYGLFDQAEELLKHALASNPGATHYRGKLLETYFAAGKKDEFERLAAELHKSIGNRSSRIWDKAIAMGKEIAPSNPLFSGAADSGLKAADFAPAKPQTADLDLGEAGGAMTPDIDFGEVGPTETALDLDISGAFDKTMIADGDETMIMDTNSPMLADADNDDRTLIVDETSLDAMQPQRKKDVTDSELNINFDADELGLGADVELEAAEPPAEATMAMDIALDIDNIDGITDVDNNSGASAADDLIAELGGDDSELSLDGASDTEFDLPEDDDTIIDAGDDTMSGEGSEDEISTKLDLARAYMDMGDYDGASSTLEEVLSEGNDKQKREAEELLDQIN